jgi:Zn-dependent protease with chaperone function
MRGMRKKLFALSLLAVTAAMLVAAPIAAAEGNGQGWAGETNDKMIVLIFFGIIVFIPLFALVASLIQRSLERRKDARMAGERAVRDDARWRGGW